MVMVKWRTKVKSTSQNSLVLTYVKSMASVSNHWLLDYKADDLAVEPCWCSVKPLSLLFGKLSIYNFGSSFLLIHGNSKNSRTKVQLTFLNTLILTLVKSIAWVSNHWPMEYRTDALTVEPCWPSLKSLSLLFRELSINNFGSSFPLNHGNGKEEDQSATDIPK